MKAAERRQKIIESLSQVTDPISASHLAKTLGVSRQIIVGDVALLRANGNDIISTPRGYVLTQSLYSSQFIGKIACRHDISSTREELELIVGNGGIIVDVEVEHPVYGMLTAPLNIKSNDDINNFMSKIETSQATLLSTLTQGIHVHTISCQSKDEFDKIKADLTQASFILGEN